jgi:hypothetical protein
MSLRVGRRFAAGWRTLPTGGQRGWSLPGVGGPVPLPRGGWPGGVVLFHRRSDHAGDRLFGRLRQAGQACRRRAGAAGFKRRLWRGHHRTVAGWAGEVLPGAWGLAGVQLGELAAQHGRARLPLRWEITAPAGGFPVLDVDLTLTAAAEGTAVLALTGSYRPGDRAPVRRAHRRRLPCPSGMCHRPSRRPGRTGQPRQLAPPVASGCHVLIWHGPGRAGPAAIRPEW